MLLAWMLLLSYLIARPGVCQFLIFIIGKKEENKLRYNYFLKRKLKREKFFHR